MAAADYYTPSTRPPYSQQPTGLQPPPGPQRASSQPTFAYQPPPQNTSGPPPHSQYPPPPYQQTYINSNEPKPSVHFAPSVSPPSQNQHRPTPSNQPRPEPYTLNQPNYQASPAHQLAPYQQQYIPPTYQNQYQPPHQSQHQLRPYNPPRHSTGELSESNGYASDPERHRRKHRDRSRRTSETSRSTKADAFLGAAGGGLIGDLIFPGLGTVGGALVGWVGGKDYGKHRKWREDKRDRDQDRWERKYGSDRSRSHSHDHDRGDRRRGSHERRKGYD